MFFGSDGLFGKAPASDVALKDARFVFGAKYDTEKFGVVVSMYHNFFNYTDMGRTYSDFMGGGGAQTLLSFDNTDLSKALPHTTHLLFGVKVVPTDGLTVNLSVGVANLASLTVKASEFDGNDFAGIYKKGDFNPFYSIIPKLGVSYSAGKLGVGFDLSGIKFEDAFYSAEANKADEDKGEGKLMPVTIEITPSYAITDAIGLAATFAIKINNGGSDQFGFGFKPKATFDLGGGASFVVFDSLDIYGKSKSIGDTDYEAKHPIANTGAWSGGYAGIENSIQFDFVWSF
jgi:hypothetical protein